MRETINIDRVGYIAGQRESQRDWKRKTSLPKAVIWGRVTGEAVCFRACVCVFVSTIGFRSPGDVYDTPAAKPLSVSNVDAARA